MEKNKFIALVLSVMMVLSVNVGMTLCDPEKPVLTDKNSNEAIEQYNKEVKTYNKEVDKHNAKVDKDYSEAKEKVEKYNTEASAHNASEEQRVVDQTAHNEQATKDAEAANAEIARQNEENKQKAEEAKARNEEKKAAAEEANRAEDERVARANQAEDERVQAAIEHNEQEEAAYAEKYAQYEIDKYYEDKILELGYESVDAYNQKAIKRNNQIDALYSTYYNMTRDEVIESKEKNASAKEPTVEDTYEITEATEKAGKDISVKVEHIFYDADGNEYKTYSNEFVIDANDTITFSAISRIGDAVADDNSVTFYHQTYDEAGYGFWYEGYCYCASAANANDYDFVKGDVHTVSFKDGKLHDSDPEDIIITYNYFWSKIIKYDYSQTYNTPVEPTKDIWDTTPKYETPNYVVYELEDESYEELPYVQPDIVVVVPADIWELMDEPTRAAYLEHLAEVALHERTDTTPTRPTIAIVPQTTTVEDTAVPASTAPTSTITPTNIPKVAPVEDGSWALINLVCVILGLILGVASVLMRKKTDEEATEEEEDADDEDRKQTTITKVVNIIVGIIALIVFIFTEDMSLPMTLVDKYTILMVIMTLINAIDTAIITKKTNNDNSEEEKIEE